MDVTTQAGCAWTAVSQAPWITITAGASGTGNGRVGLTITANTGLARTGTVTIGSQTFTVTQMLFPPRAYTCRQRRRACREMAANSRSR